MRLSREQLETIKQKADIVEVISRYVELSPKGSYYIGLCPFHEDHNASMHVHPQKQFYKCFSCGAGGDVFGFVKDIEGLDFLHAVEKVANTANIPLKIQPSRPNPHQREQDALALFNRYCHYLLKSKEGREARAYLEQRHFDDELLDRFEIGFAPEASASLRFFEAKKTDPAALVQSGLAGAQEGSFTFYNRITIPIHDARGNPIGQSARILPGREGPKYVNTRSTPLFDKSATIFNYHRALPNARKNGRFILVEGAMDVLGLEKAGIHEGIACLGTALTQKQLDLMARPNVPVIVLYDQDEAGQKAVWRFGQMALERGLSFSVASLKAGKDPDECFDLEGREGVEESLSSTRSFVEFAFDYLQKQFNLSNYEDKRQYARQIAAIIKKLDPSEQSLPYQKLLDQTGFDFRQPGFPVNSSGPELQPAQPGYFQPAPESGEPYPGWQAVTFSTPADAIQPPYTDSSLPSKRRGRPYSRRTGRSPARFIANPPTRNAMDRAQRIILYWLLRDRKCMEYFNEELGFLKDAVFEEFAHEVSYFYQGHYAFDKELFLKQENCEKWKGLLEELEAMQDVDDLREFRDSIIKLQEDWMIRHNQSVKKKVASSTDLAAQIKELEAFADQKKEQLKLRKTS